MTLTIQTRLKFRGYQREVHKIDDTLSSESSYPSVKEMQKILLRRFPNRKNVRNRKIENGIVRIEGTPKNHRTQVITLT